ncbi:hypothetical protein RJ55_01735 [Drechmeria coniospora]|nr:hypothetical protein RJ55_01735 [Drechmeria coniospora]
MFWNVVEGKIDAAELLAEYPEDTGNPSFTAMTHGLWHVSHCFDYVRQALMCRPDLTLEGPVHVNGRLLVVGWESPHQCQSWDTIWKYFEEHSVATF